MGNNNYLKKETKVYNLLLNYKNYTDNHRKKTGPDGGMDQVAFFKARKREQDEEETEENPKKDRSELMGFNCLQYGCYKSECKNPDTQKQGGGMPVVTAAMPIMRAIILTITSKSLRDPM